MSSETLIRDRTAETLANLPPVDLRWLVKNARRELSARNYERWLWKDRLVGAAQAMSNLMAGVTWALACRQTLRRSKGHTPDTGKKPQSGEMWLPRELLTALRAEIKERRWSPLGALGHQDVLNWLRVEAGRPAAAAKLAAMGPGDHVAEFKVRLSGQHAVLHVDLGSEDRFGS